MEPSIFAAQFSDMFKDFVKQQQSFQKSIEKTFKSIDKTLAKKVLPKKTEYENESQRKYLAGRPQNVQKPRKVVQDSVKVIIEDVSKKAAAKLDDDDSTTINNQIQGSKSSGLLEKVLGGLLLGVTAVAGGFALKQLGIDTSALSTVFGVAGKFSKLLKKLPLVGLLISTGEALAKFKAGGPKNIISGMMDIASGIAYMFPGIGTAIGLGIDVLNYFFEKTVDKAETEGRQVETFGDIYQIIKDSIMNSKFGRWFTELGTKFKAVFTNPGAESLYDYFEHIGLVWLGDMFNKFDKGIGNLLGLTNESGDMTSLTDWMSSWVADNIVTPIMNFFDYVGEQIANAINAVKEYATNLVNKTKEIIEEYATPTGIAENLMGVRESDTILEGDALIASSENYRKLFNRLKEQHNYTHEQILDLVKDVDDDMPQVKARILGAEIQKLKGQDKLDGEWVPVDQTENNKNLRFKTKDPLNDFSIFNGKVNGIVSGNKFQEFSKDDSIIGFKDGEALVKGIESLLAVGKEQIEILQMYLENNNSQPVIAPSTNNTNNYTFNVESGVSAFRKALS